MSGLRAILFATAVAGAVGYLLQGLVGRFVSPDTFLRFSVFWSALYLLVAAVNGLQQETTRAAHPASRARDAPGRVLGFGLVCAVSVAVLIVVTSPLWADLIFPSEPFTFTVALAIGAAGFVGVSLMSGLFYGVKLWSAVAGITILDSFLRLLLVSASLVFRPSLEVLAAAVIAPFPLSLGLLWLATRSRVKGRYVLDVGPRRLVWNAARTVGGSISTGVLTSGYPLLIAATSRADPQTTVGALVFVVTITRAPLVIPALALQSYLTVHLRDSVDVARTHVVRLLTAVAGISVLAAALAYTVEPWLLQTIWGTDYTVSAWVSGGIALTAGLTAGLCVSGAAALSASQHGLFAAGWASAAVTSVLLLLLPLELETRVLLSMGIGPLIGVLVHLSGILSTRGPLPKRVRASSPP